MVEPGTQVGSCLSCKGLRWMTRGTSSSSSSSIRGFATSGLCVTDEHQVVDGPLAGVSVKGLTSSTLPCPSFKLDPFLARRWGFEFFLCFFQLFSSSLGQRSLSPLWFSSSRMVLTARICISLLQHTGFSTWKKNDLSAKAVTIPHLSSNSSLERWLSPLYSKASSKCLSLINQSISIYPNAWPWFSR